MSPPADLCTETELVIEIAGRIRKRGDQKRVAQQLGLRQGTLANILTAGRGIGPHAAAAMGYRRVVLFERVG